MTALRKDQPWLTTASLMVLAGVAIAAALWYTRAIMVPFVLAILISYLVSPLVDFLQIRARIPRVLSLTFSLLVVVAFLVLLGLLITFSTSGLLENTDLYRERVANFLGIVTRPLSVLDRFGIDLGQDTFIAGIRQSVLNMAPRAAGTVINLVTNGFLVLIFIVFLVVGRTPHERRRGIYAEIDGKIRRYLLTKFATSASTGLLTAIILTAFGLDLAIVFGVLAFLLNFIPSIGSVIATLLPLPVALVQYESIFPIVGVVAFPGLVQMTIGNVIEPKVMGEGLDLHPVTILLTLVFWGLLWGIVGMVLATPITAVIKIVFSKIDMTRPVAELMAGRLPPEVTGEYQMPSSPG